MNYNLAKQLKDAGFSQKHYCDSNDNISDIVDAGSGETCSNPTLSELIEACGERFAYLAREHDGLWRARADGGDSGTFPPVYGDTPEEAVANLWLALNN